MLAHQLNRYHSPLSAKEALRAHVDQLSPAQQREFISAALELIAAREMLDEMEGMARYLQAGALTAQDTLH